jgi:hypothetical protein
MASLPTVRSADMTTAIRDFGTGVETRGRQLSSSVRHLVGSVGVGLEARNRVVREIYASPTRLLGWAANALAESASIPVADTDGLVSDAWHPARNYVVVDRSLTRC